MLKPYNITSSCVFSHQIVYKNGLPIFENLNADLSAFMLSFYQHIGMQYSKFYKMDQLSKLGLLAAEILLQGLDIKERLVPEQTGIFLCNSSASLDTDLKYFDTAKDLASPALFVYTLPNIMIGEISIRHGLKGENCFVVSEQFDGKFIEQYANTLFNNDNLHACILGWVEVIGSVYKAAMFLVEKNVPGLTFTAENLQKIYEIDHGETNV